MAIDLTIRIDFAPAFADANGIASTERRYVGSNVTLVSALADLLALSGANDADVTNVSVYPND